MYRNCMALLKLAQRLTLTKFIVDLTSKIRQLLHSVFPEAEKDYFIDLIKILEDYPTPADILLARRAIMRMKLKYGKEILEAAKTTIGIPGEIHRDMLKHLVYMLNESAAKRNDVSKQIKIAVDSHPCGRILISFPRTSTTGRMTEALKKLVMSIRFLCNRAKVIRKLNQVKKETGFAVAF